MREDESYRDLGNVFMARLMTGYGANTVSITDDGIAITHKTRTKSFEWADIEWWSSDEFAFIVATSALLNFAIPADQLPADPKERILENLRVLGPEYAPQVRKLPESEKRRLRWKRAG